MQVEEITPVQRELAKEFWKAFIKWQKENPKGGSFMMHGLCLTVTPKKSK